MNIKYHNHYKIIKQINLMKEICYKNIVQNTIYYIYHNEIKYIGVFCELYDYDYFAIALFNDVIKVNSIDKTSTTKNFIIGSYYNKVNFYTPELEQLLLEQILRQKTNDYFLSKVIAKSFTATRI